MKLKIYKLLFLVFLFKSFDISAQEIRWSQQIESKGVESHPHILHQNSKYFYAFVVKGKSILLEKYNKLNLEKVYSKKVFEDYSKFFKNDFKKFFDWYDLGSRIKLLGSQILIMRIESEKKSEQNIIHANIYESESGKLKQENIELCRFKEGAPEIITSQNKKFMHVFVRHNDFKKKSFLLQNIIIDDKLDIAFNKTDENKFKNSMLETFNYIVDNEGSLVYLKKENKFDNYIIAYDAFKNYEKWEEKIELEGIKPKEQITKTTLSVGLDNDIIVTGFLSASGSFANKLKGIFFMKLESTSKEIIVNKISLFSEKFKGSYLTTKELKRKKQPSIENEYNNIQVVNRKDGGAFLIAEKVSAVLSGGHNYYFDDIIAFNLSNEGSLIWDRRVFKDQTHSARQLTSLSKIKSALQYYSFFASFNKSKLNIYFNESIDNIRTNSNGIKTVKNIEETVPIKYMIKVKNGEINSEKLDCKTTDKYRLQPIQCYVDNLISDVILLIQNDKGYKFGIIN